MYSATTELFLEVLVNSSKEIHNERTTVNKAGFLFDFELQAMISIKRSSFESLAIIYAEHDS